jgi:hypothetical protein
MSRATSAVLLSLTLLYALTSASPLAALTVPFTEDFSTDDSNWMNVGNTDPVYSANGGPNGVGDGYISASRTLTSAVQGQTVFRGQDNFNSSSDAFVGDWVAGGVETFSFWIRHNHSAPLTIGTRFATTSNSPAWSIQQAGIAPNIWTLIEFEIDPSNPNFQPEGLVAFNDVFPLLGYLQIAAASPGSATGSVTFDLDKVSISAVPEPSAIFLALTSMSSLLFLRRRASRNS